MTDHGQDLIDAAGVDHEPGAGKCAFCPGWYRITWRGVVGRHAGPFVGGVCPGAGLDPAVPVGCARCGVTGRAIDLSSRLCHSCLNRRREAEREARHRGGER